MSDALGLEALQRLAHRESHSLMQYLVGAFPWTRGESEALDRVRDMIETERDALAALTRYLYRHKMPPPHSGGYPTDFTSLNFIDLGYFISLLIKHQEEGIAQAQADLASVPDGEGKHLAEALVRLKRQHLAALRELPKLEPAVTS